MSAKTRITVTVGKNDTVLADWTDIVLLAPDCFPESEMEVVSFFRGTQVKVFDRGNTSHVIRFTVLRDHPNLESARAWALDARRLTPRQGDVTLLFRGYNNNTISRRMPAAGIQVRPLPNIGMSTRTEYQLIGGEIVV